MRKFIRKYVIYFALITFLIGAAIVWITDNFLSTTQRISRDTINIIEQFNSAIVEKDEAMMETFLSENITIRTNSTAWGLSKRDLILQLIRANIKSFVIKNYSIQISGERAYLSFDQEELMLHDGREISHRAEYTYLFVPAGKTWKLVEITRHD